MFLLSFIRSHSLWRKKLFCLSLVFRCWTLSDRSADDSSRFGLPPLQGSQQVQVFSVTQPFFICFLVCMHNCSTAKASTTWCSISWLYPDFYRPHTKQAACSNILPQKPSRPRLNIHLHTWQCKKHHGILAEFHSKLTLHTQSEPVCTKIKGKLLISLDHTSDYSLKSLLCIPFSTGVLQ